MPEPQNRVRKNGAPSAFRRRGVIRRAPVRSDLPLDLPITGHEIQIVAEALGADIAALFAEDH